MIKNKDLLAYFYQEKNLRKLEGLIDESIQTLNSCVQPQSVAELELFSKNNIEITTNKEANELLDELVYPRIQEMIGDTDIKKPKIVIQGNGFLKDGLSLQKDSWKYLAFGGVTVVPLSLAFGSNISEAITMAVMLPILYTAKSLFQYKNAGGWVDPFIKTTAHVRSDSISYFIYALAHEVVHCVQGQTSYLLNAVNGLTGRNLLYVEGSAELIAQKVVGEIDGGIWDDNKQLRVSSVANQRLLNSYHELCAELKIGENKKKFRKNIFIPKEVYDCSMYDLGFSTMKLLTENRDDEIYKDILMNTFKL